MEISKVILAAHGDTLKQIAKRYNELCDTLEQQEQLVEEFSPLPMIETKAYIANIRREMLQLDAYRDALINGRVNGYEEQD